MVSNVSISSRITTHFGTSSQLGFSNQHMKHVETRNRIHPPQNSTGGPLYKINGDYVTCTFMCKKTSKSIHADFEKMFGMFFKKVCSFFPEKTRFYRNIQVLTQDVQRCRGRLNCFLNDSAPFLCCSFSPGPQTRNKCWKMLQDIVMRCWTQQKNMSQNSRKTKQWKRDAMM